MGDEIDLEAVVADAAAFRAWYDATAPRVYAYLLARTGSVTVAEDLTQETFIEVVRHPGTFDGRGDAVPWLVGIARHRLARHFSGRRRDDDRASNLVRQISVEPSADPSFDGVESADALDRALATLPGIQRTALLLRFGDDLSIREVAVSIGRSEDATESLVRRARAALSAAYRDDQHAD
jgi:RNA polymerase sigma-70 factor (ECF subfamily)